MHFFLSLHVVSADFHRDIYAVCPELLLEGDEQYFFGLFTKFLHVLENDECPSGDSAKTNLKVFTSFFVDARTRQCGAGRSVEEIGDRLISDDFFLVTISFVYRSYVAWWL